MTARPAAPRARGTARAATSAAAGLVALGVPLLSVLSASPAAAVYRDDGDDPGAGLSALETVGVFVGLPVLLFAVITALVYATNRGGERRYRPGAGWYSAPVWFHGPPAHERPKDVDDLPTEGTMAGGGASARW
ncbi:hypothetical protein [Vallicoccus soli]|uniref:aa3-type cytochrome oxidase subunit CtaJ n=1 Tax=Vallicoccus soli TaxID=2339232 RepID=UPI00105A6BA6|nr:hypothetical protein [Vallicoccus soli]